MKLWLSVAVMFGQRLSVPGSVELPVQPYRHDYGDDKRENIGHGLCQNNAVQSKDVRQQQNRREKVDALSAGPEKTAFSGFSHDEE